MEQYYGLTAEMYRAVVALVDDRMREIRLTRQDFDRLVQAQGRVEGRMERVEAALERLAEAQARTEERVEDLTQAQARTEERVGRLEEGQAAMQAAIRELAQAQARTEVRVEELAQAQAHTETTLRYLVQQVGFLSDNVGFGLEDVGRVVLPGYLQRHYGLQLEGPLGEELSRKFFEVDGEPVEINLYSEGWRNGQRVIFLGEAKSRIGGGEVHRFTEHLELVEPLVTGEVWRVMFGYFIHPSAMQPAEERNILLVASYQR